MKLFAMVLALVGVAFLAIWLGFPPSVWGGDTTVFGYVALVLFGAAKVFWGRK